MAFGTNIIGSARKLRLVLSFKTERSAEERVSLIEDLMSIEGIQNVEPDALLNHLIVTADSSMFTQSMIFKVLAWHDERATLTCERWVCLYNIPEPKTGLLVRLKKRLPV